MSDKSERIQILEMIENGVISAEQGARLLRAIEGEIEPDPESQLFPDLEPQPEGIVEGRRDQPSPEANTPPPDFGGWRRWWIYPLWAGVGITILGGLLMFWAYQASGAGFWFACAWLPFLLGLAVMVLAWGSRTARWMHLRVHQKAGERPQNIAISFPLPLRFAAWFVRTFGRRIPQLNKTGLDELILALGTTTGPQTPFYVEVDEGEGGERVQIYIG